MTFKKYPDIIFFVGKLIEEPQNPFKDTPGRYVYFQHCVMHYCMTVTRNEIDVWSSFWRVYSWGHRKDMDPQLSWRQKDFQIPDATSQLSFSRGEVKAAAVCCMTHIFRKISRIWIQIPRILKFILESLIWMYLIWLVNPGCRIWHLTLLFRAILFATLSFLRGWTYSIAIRLVGTKDTFGANANWEFLGVLFIGILSSSICEGDFLGKNVMMDILIRFQYITIFKFQIQIVHKWWSKIVTNNPLMFSH